VAVTPAKEWKQPAQKAEDFAPPPSYPHSPFFYAVVSDEIHRVIGFFNRPAEAEAMLETVLEDEPDWRETLYIACVEFLTGGRTSAPSSLSCSGGRPKGRTTNEAHTRTSGALTKGVAEEVLQEDRDENQDAQRQDDVLQDPDPGRPSG
jgi:hypothetical protein